MTVNDIFIFERESIKEALKKLDNTAEKVLLVVENGNRLLGTLTDGDIRRSLLKGESLSNGIGNAYNRKPVYLTRSSFSIEKAKDTLIKDKLELIPVLDNKGRVVDFITWSQAFSTSDKSAHEKEKIDIPVVIMAGGKSTRLEPFTKILPKPLIPIGDKPIIEIIIDEFKKYGVDEYFIILNYKGEMIESYFNNIDKDYRVKYIRESEFGGTAGGLKLLEKEIGDIFIVSNCDVIVKADFKEVLDFHKSTKASLTVLSSIKHYKIPYGIVKFKEGGEVVDVLEKPEYTFTINDGVYFMNRECLKYMNDGHYFEMTDLIRCLIKNGRKAVTYPVNENDYIDVGQWEEYKKALEKMKF